MSQKKGEWLGLLDSHLIETFQAGKGACEKIGKCEKPGSLPASLIQKLFFKNVVQSRIHITVLRVVWQT